MIFIFAGLIGLETLALQVMIIVIWLTPNSVSMSNKSDKMLVRCELIYFMSMSVCPFIWIGQMMRGPCN